MSDDIEPKRPAAPSAREAAARIDLVLPAPCVAGVEANLALLAQHWRTLRGGTP